MVDAAPAPAPPLSSLGLCEGAFYERRGSFADGPTPRPMAATAQELTAADQVGAEFVASEEPCASTPPANWGFRVGARGTGYYRCGSGSAAPSVFAPVLAPIRRGWGTRALEALLRDDPSLLKSAASDMAASIEELKFNLATQAKGGNSWYYDDVRVRAGYDPDPLPPKPGDTLLHMALRHHRSIAFIATLLKIGADPLATNNAGERADLLDPRKFGLALEQCATWAREAKAAEKVKVGWR